MPGRRAAFFDFDKTLLDCESSRLLIRYMGIHRRHFFSEKHLNPLFVIRVLVMYQLYKHHIYPDEKMTALLLNFFRGRRLSTFESIAEDLFENHYRPHLAPNVMACVEAHRKKGDILVLISGGLKYILNVVARELGFDHLLCTELETGQDGLLTGRAEGIICVDSSKKFLCEKLALDLGIDLESSSAYGNHQADIPMLETVGNAFVVEPTEPLLKTAIERGWPVLRYR
jgi:HAD superfamily hydrolase (TIGR01490 family)